MQLWFLTLFPLVCCFVTNHSKSQWLKMTNVYFLLMDLQVNCNSAKLGQTLVHRFQAPGSTLQLQFRSALCISHSLWSSGFIKSRCKKMNGRNTRGQIEMHDTSLVFQLGTCMLSFISTFYWPTQVTWPKPSSMMQENILCLPWLVLL